MLHLGSFFVCLGTSSTGFILSRFIQSMFPLSFYYYYFSYSSIKELKNEGLYRCLYLLSGACPVRELQKTLHD